MTDHKPLVLDPEDPTRTPVQTRDGRKARITALLSHDKEFPIEGRIDGVEALDLWTRDGFWKSSRNPNPRDLTNVPSHATATSRARREDALAKVAACVLQDRDATHGEPEDNFADSAALWSVIFHRKLAPGEMFTPADVAAAQAALKLARYGSNPGHADNMIDLAGFGVCGYGCMVKAEGIGE